MTDKKIVSLALGSGGARGMAHIGVIRWLDEHDYQIKVIAGSSIGALIGGIYAAGELDTYTKWVTALRKSDVLRLLDFAYNRAGLFSGDRLMKKLEDMLGNAQIEDLPVSFTAVTTDLDNGREVWINKGPLFDAVRASIAIPSVFTPVKYHGRILVDGGVLNPIPIAPTLRVITDMTIAVSLSGREVQQEELLPTPQKEQEKGTSYQQAINSFIESIQERFNLNEEEDETNIVDVMTRSIESMQNTIARFKLAAYNPNYLLEVPANACGMFDFYRAGEMIDLGYNLMENMMSKSVK
jgi:NTE family protein